MKTFTDPGDNCVFSTANVTADKSRYIIRDFHKEAHLKDRPYVEGWPFMRFYAEVPIRSPSGYVIGGYCVIDDQPRGAFGDAEVKTLQEISDSIGNHLELMRMKQDYERAERLMRGLSSFVEGQSSIRLPSGSHPQQVQFQGSEPRGATEESGKTSLNGVMEESADSSSKNGKQEPNWGSDGQFPTLRHPETTSSSGLSILAQPTLPHPSVQEMSTVTPEPVDKNGDSTVSYLQSRDSLVPINIKRTFSRASNLIRESMDLCGVVFFDAYLSGLALRSTLRRRCTKRSENGSDGEDASSSNDEWLQKRVADDLLTSSDILEDHSSPIPGGHPGHMKDCERLGQSLSPNSSPSNQQRSLPGPLLKRLLRKYPYGQIFTSEQSGFPSSADQKSRRASELLQNGPSHSMSRKRRKTLAKQAESILLFDLLPGARSIIFYPLWDSHKARWFAGCIGWTTDPKRALQTEEVTYLAAFGNSVMAEINRIEAVMNDRAKSDFISNISHELRSPLHGILASAELLQDSSTGPEQDGMIEMVNSCGRTLLDTMNHLLDYAKINNIAKYKKSSAGLDSETGGSRETMGLTTEFDLSELVEEVVDAVHTGYQYQKRLSASFKNGASADFAASGASNTAHAKSRPEKLPNNTVSVILDICERNDWTLSSEAGAWRRIVMNLFGNALKYTALGYIKVSLKADDTAASTNDPSSTIVRLSITDSGKGISEEYLKNRLYTPFAQEDSLSVGAGLGLSIVQQIVTSLGGTVDIQSKVGFGTSVTVSIPLNAGNAAPERRSSIARICPQCRGLTICLIGFEDKDLVTDSLGADLGPQKKRKLALRSALSRILTNWFGFNVASADSIQSASADLLLAEEEYLTRVQQNQSHHQQPPPKTGDCPLIVLRKDLCRKPGFTVMHTGKTTYISQPFGPTKLGKAIESCLHCRVPLAEINAPNGEMEVSSPSEELSEDGDSDPASPMDISHPAFHEQQAAKATKSQGMKVLLVDDNDINLKIMVTYMRKLQCSYVTASNGLQAFERYRDAAKSGASFKYVLMDVSMPVMDGLSATREIRALEHEKTLLPTTIVALTGLASSKTEEEAFASGVNLFLTKPVQLRRLKDVLKVDEDERQFKEPNGRTAKKRKVADMG